MAGDTRNKHHGDAHNVVQVGAVHGDLNLKGSSTSSPTVLSLPRVTSAFTGRAAELAVLLAAANAPEVKGVVAVHAIDGMAGIGKTAFAVHAAHRLADQFPDAQIFLRLHAHTPGRRPVDPVDALGSLLEAIGVAPQNIPVGVDSRVAMWRSQLAGKRALIVLDDASGHQQVEPLLPATPGCLVLVTSRRRLAALDASVSLALDTLPPDEAVRLFVRLSGRRAEEVDAESTTRVVEMCGHLPLAIALLAGRLRHHPSWSARDLVDSLGVARDRISELRAENIAVATAFDLSYRDLGVVEQRFFRSLGLHPGVDLDAHSTAAIAGISAAEAREHLESLYGDHLVDEPVYRRYRMHDLVREYSRTLGEEDPEADRRAAFDRLIRYYVDAAAKADGFIAAEITREAPRAATARDFEADLSHLSDRADAWAWMRNENVNILACVERISTSPDLPQGSEIALAASLATYFGAVGPWDRALALHEAAAVVAQRAGDRLSLAKALNSIGRLQRLIGVYLVAAETLTRAATIYAELDHKLGQVGALVQLGGALRQMDAYSRAAESYLQALEICRAAGDRLDEAAALNGLGIIRLVQGRLLDAVEAHQQALDIYHDLDDQLGQADARNELGVVRRVLGEYAEAIGHHRLALAVYRDLNDGYNHAFTLNNLGTALRMTGDYEGAVEAHEQAIEISRRLGDRIGQAIGLGEMGAALRLNKSFGAAAEASSQALELYNSIGHRLGIAEALNERGALLLSVEDPAGAVELHAQALEISRQIGTPLEQARALEGLGRCAASLGQINEAAGHLQEAIGLYRRIGAAETVTPLYRSLARGEEWSG